MYPSTRQQLADQKLKPFWGNVDNHRAVQQKASSHGATECAESVRGGGSCREHRERNPSLSAATLLAACVLIHMPDPSQHTSCKLLPLHSASSHNLFLCRASPVPLSRSLRDNCLDDAAKSKLQKARGPNLKELQL